MLFDLTATEASQAIHSGEISPVELVKSCLNQIDQLEERVGAWETLDREGAIEQASVLESEISQKAIRGPLHGIPVGVKDIVFTEGMRTSAGSRFLKDFIPKYDATVVARLRQAGAVILGKTVTTEYACFDPAVTRNPWNLDHTPGGSSSGSAAAVACRMCPVALASQTGGSISRPAAYCGIVGLKPTYSRVSVHGVVPVSFSLDQVGVLARSVEDTALMLQVMAGEDAQDPLCSENPVPDFSKDLDNQNMPRIGIVRPYFLEKADSAMKEAVEIAANAFRAGGAKVVEVVLPPSFKEVHRNHRLVMYAEAAAYHACRFERQAEKFQPGIRSLIEEGLLLPAAAYADARFHQLQFRSDIRSAFHKVDVLLTPATLTPAPEGLGSTGDPAFNSPWSYSGLPTVALPVGSTTRNLPTGIQLVGQAFEENRLLRFAKWCEIQLAFDAEPAL